jgi:hypothetical protein
VLGAPLVEDVTELRRDLDVVARDVRERAAHDLLVGALAVDVAGVEEGDPELERSLEQVAPLAAGDSSPPGRSESPRPEADL